MNIIQGHKYEIADSLSWVYSDKEIYFAMFDYLKAILYLGKMLGPQILLYSVAAVI